MVITLLKDNAPNKSSFFGHLGILLTLQWCSWRERFGAMNRGSETHKKTFRYQWLLAKKCLKGFWTWWFFLLLNCTVLTNSLHNLTWPSLKNLYKQIDGQPCRGVAWFCQEMLDIDESRDFRRGFRVSTWFPAESLRFFGILRWRWRKWKSWILTSLVWWDVWEPWNQRQRKIGINLLRENPLRCTNPEMIFIRVFPT